MDPATPPPLPDWFDRLPEERRVEFERARRDADARELRRHERRRRGIHLCMLRGGGIFLALGILFSGLAPLTLVTAPVLGALVGLVWRFAPWGTIGNAVFVVPVYITYALVLAHALDQPAVFAGFHAVFGTLAAAGCANATGLWRELRVQDGDEV